MPTSANAPDLVRAIYLLWGHHPAPGRSGVTVQQIVHAGIELADAEGLESTSMRKVAEKVSVSTMSLYKYVPGKDDLTELMVDQVYGEVYSDVDAARSAGDWRAGVRFIAETNRDLFTRHPWLLDVHVNRALLGPNSVRKYEAELRPLDRIGLDDIAMDTTLHMLLALVESSARAHRDALRARNESGMSDTEWWQVVSPALEHVMSGSDYPVSDRVGTAAGSAFDAPSSPDHTLRFGVEMIIAGIEAQLSK